MSFKMMTRLFLFVSTVLLTVFAASSQKNTTVKDTETRILLSTDSGNMVIRLYDSTPLHRDNFIEKVKAGFYDSLLFHRVIKDFMIQGGDPNSKNAKPGEMLGAGSAPGPNVPAEFKPYFFHKKGVLAAARDNNPQKSSSNCQFYIVQGKKYTDDELKQMEQRMNKTFTPEQKDIYKTIGGTPFLDGNYTVYGEVEMGENVIDKIASVPTAAADRPVSDVRMKMKVLTAKELKSLKKQLKK